MSRHERETLGQLLLPRGNTTTATLALKTQAGEESGAAPEIDGVCVTKFFVSATAATDAPGREGWWKVPSNYLVI